jgi:glycosyltransferase involved in cell wall biosynthesis
MTLATEISSTTKRSATNAAMHFAHVPTPGDHYSPATGSAVMTVIYELSRAHAVLGHPSTIVVSRGTTDGYPPYPIGTVLEADLPTALPSRNKRLLEAACARIALRRPFTAGLYANVPDALGASFDGTLFIHNSPAAMPLLRRRLPNARLALYVHNQLFNSYAPREVRWILANTDVVICVSEYIAQNVTQRAALPTRPAKIKVVLNGVDTDRFTPPPSPPTGEPVILFLGRVMDIKGPDLLLQAATAIATPDRPFKVRIVGSSNFTADGGLSPYEKQLRLLAAPIADRVEFIPFLPRNQIIPQFHAATIYCVPSNWDDPCPLTVLEGLSCGLPMIVSQRGGIPEQALDAAHYFSPPDTTAFSHHLANLLDNPSLRSTIAAKARARALQLSTAQQYATLTESLPLR